MAPLVIDLLNLKPSFDHHYRVYGDWSPAVQDYVNYGIMDWIGSKEFDRLLEHVEPYQFKERFELPKLIINGTVDEFFVTDSWKFYYHDLPGYKQLQYVPNGNHGLAGSYNTSNVFSFFDALVHNQPLPQWQWKVVSNRFEVSIEDDSKDYEIALWSSTNPKARDFRIWEVGQNWVKTIIPKNENGVYSIQAPENKNGYTSSVIEVTFKRNPESPLVFTTGTIVLPETYPFESYQSLIPMGTR
jgi:PhoPQ-activated pathogenicity-related protein